MFDRVFQQFRKANPLHGHHLSCSLGFALRIEDYTQASKYPPGLPQPEDAQNQKGILHHGPRQLVTGDRKLELSALAWQYFRRRSEFTLLAAKPAMGQSRGQELERLVTQIPDLPRYE